jgi:hypothetical protein
MPHDSSDASETPKVKREPSLPSGRVRKHARNDSRSKSAVRRPKKEEEEVTSDEEKMAPGVYKAESDEDEDDIGHHSRKRVKGVNGQPRPSTVLASGDEDEDEDDGGEEHIARVEKIFVRDPKDG